jgi:hypothetical protein
MYKAGLFLLLISSIQRVSCECMCVCRFCVTNITEIPLHVAVIIVGKVPEIKLAMSMVVGKRVILYIHF